LNFFTLSSLVMGESTQMTTIVQRYDL